MKSINSEKGITIKELKELVKNLPEIDQDGEDYTFWIEHTDKPTLSSIVRSITQLNDGDLIVSIRG